MKVMIGIDPHKASHTAVAIGAGRGPDLERQGAGDAPPGRTALELGRALREANLGHRVSRRPGLSVGPAAGRPRRGGARRPGHLGLADPGARHRALQQERPQRCPLDRHRRTACTEAAPVEPANHGEVLRLSVQAKQRYRDASAPGWSADCTPSSPSSLRAELPRKCTFLMPRRSWPRSRRDAGPADALRPGPRAPRRRAPPRCPNQGLASAHPDGGEGLGNLGHRDLWSGPDHAAADDRLLG